MKIIFANIGWMTHYQGVTESDKIRGGGDSANQKKHEVHNFYDFDGRCLGFVQTPNGRTIALERIDSNVPENEPFLRKVLVVWTATNPKGGRYIIGWYKNATVFRERQVMDTEVREGFDFYFAAKTKNCVLLPPSERTFVVPRANEKPGFFGQSNVWYADKDDFDVKVFKRQVKDYIDEYEPAKRIEKEDLMVDPETYDALHNAAIEFVTEQYTAKGFEVTPTEGNSVWDLEARKDKTLLKLEVKGLLKRQVSILLSADEYDKMNANRKSFRLCVVTKALKKPELVTFFWDGSNWICEENPAIKLAFAPSCILATIV